MCKWRVVESAGLRGVKVRLTPSKGGSFLLVFHPFRFYVLTHLHRFFIVKWKNDKKNTNFV